MGNLGPGQPQSPIEQRLAAVLDGFGIAYHSQYVAKEQEFGSYCRSKYPCRCGLPQRLSEDEWSEGEEDWREDWDECQWSTAGVTAPKYVLDFAVIGDAFRLAIECDGREYHAAQVYVDRDRRRQQELEREGWSFLRFTGTQITRDVAACGLQVQQWLDTRTQPQQGRLW